MKRFTFVLFLLALSLTACRGDPAQLGMDAPADNVPDIVGEYALNAFDPTGEEYGGSLFITAGEAPNEYELQWLVSGGIHQGTGTLEGNQLTFTWKSLAETDQDVSGSGAYTVTVNGELYGTRYIDGVENPGVESAYPNQ
ncbi:MAG TPA: hypothetical protein DCY14_09835 [Anaerolineae bacterium]|nr:hypothetical protein [Anaerolineae bacterium]HRJ56757.1 hypothetical protein [Anaerolineales bacterium]